PSVTASTPLVFQLTVNDGKASSTADSVTLTVQDNVNEAPTSNAGPDQSVSAAAAVTLDGSASSDPNGETLTYAWVQTARPAVTLSTNTAQKPTLTAPSPGSVTTLTFRLTVSDTRSGTSQDTITVTVS